MRKLSVFALVVAYAHTVLGAIVRITGSGMGCGEHWPDCNSQVLPTLGSTATIIEFSHRLLAATLVTTLVALVIVATRERSAIRGPALVALGTTVVAALLGAGIVALSLSNPYLIAVHYALAMFLLATLVIANVRLGNLGARDVQPRDASGRTFRSARAAAGLAFVVVVFGALVANVPGAAPSCQGFPGCRSVLLGGLPFALHVTHRIL
ncbi:MAG TPA: COX15/CtaA family protein, partial [Gemmatimonadaceae bacterium]|nr:COX15/CtaA family protein [Gemmatimonadaceae bacterium]